MPPQLQAAKQQVAQVLSQVEGRQVDLVKDGWAQLEKGVIKLLGGPFRPEVPEHQVVALGLAAALGERLGAEAGAFWFPMREAVEGAQLGFPEALIMLSPFGAVADALARAKLDALDDVAKDVRTNLAKVRFSAAGGGARRLGPEDYMALFDPAFVQLVALDPDKAKQAWGQTPERLALDVRDAISRAGKLPPEVKTQLEQQLVSAIGRLEPGKPLRAQMPKAPRVAELVGMLFGATHTTGAAGEEFWMEVVLPLLFVGQPQAFPPLDDDELAAAKQGIDPLFLLLDVVPYQFKSPDEEGLLGAFPRASLRPPDEGFNQAQSLRMIQVSADALAEPLKQFDPQATREVIRRFGAYVQEKTGTAPTQGAAEAKQMLDAALTLLGDLKGMVQPGKVLCVRHLTEAEASSEPALSLVRQASQAPRIILAT